MMPIRMVKLRPLRLVSLRPMVAAMVSPLLRSFEYPADGTQATEALTGPISLGTQITFYLVLFGTGIRGRDSLSNVTASVDGQALPVVYAGPQPQYPGLDSGKSCSCPQTCRDPAP